MTAHEYLQKGFPEVEKMNCAEKVLNAANLAYDLGLSKQACKLSAGFGGGMGVFSTCGTVTAACMALSDLFVKEYAHEGETIKRLTSELIEKVTAEMGSIECAALREKYRTPEDGCKYVIETTAAILDGIVERELAQNGKQKAE